MEMRAVAAVAVVLCGGLQAAAFSLPAAVSLTGLQPRIAAMAPSCGTLRAQSPRSARKMVMQAAEVDVKEYIKIFGRLGEKMLFGDASAGLCCHSACENCEWRYSFDVLQAARPKWIPTYRENKFEDGREHVAKWSTIFEEGDEAVTKEQFCERLAAIKFDMPLGPSGFLTAKQADLSQEALDAFWEHMSRGKPTLSPKQMQIRLRKMLDPSSNEEGVMWPDFIDSVTHADHDDAIDEAIVVG